MDQERWDRLQAIFHRALDLPTSERLSFVEAECRGDDGMRADVEAMLLEDARGESLLDRGLPGGEVGDPAADLPLDAFGPYRILRILGQGGMGVVYLAERENFGGQVAIKLLLGGTLAPLRRRRFAREQNTLAQLQHPYIAQIYDADTLADGTPWFAIGVCRRAAHHGLLPRA